MSRVHPCEPVFIASIPALACTREDDDGGTELVPGTDPVLRVRDVEREVEILGGDGHAFGIAIEQGAGLCVRRNRILSDADGSLEAKAPRDAPHAAREKVRLDDDRSIPLSGARERQLVQQ